MITASSLIASTPALSAHRLNRATWKRLANRESPYVCLYVNGAGDL